MLDSFFLLARDGEVTLRESGDLWRLLVRILLRKVYRSVRRHHADCRSVEREQARPAEDNDVPEAAVLARAPTPTEAAALADELRCLLAPFPPAQRQIIELRLQGFKTEEIVTRVQRSARTVRRTLAALE